MRRDSLSRMILREPLSMRERSFFEAEKPGIPRQPPRHTVKTSGLWKRRGLRDISRNIPRKCEY